jgi:hypothetical protein
MSIVTIRFPEDLLESLDKKAAELQRSRSQIVLFAVQDYLSPKPVPPPEKDTKLDKVIKTKPLKVPFVMLTPEEPEYIVEPSNISPELQDAITDLSDGLIKSVQKSVAEAQAPTQQHSARCACFICKPPKDVVAEPKKKKWGKK